MISVGAEGFRLIKAQNVLSHGEINIEKARHQYGLMCEALEPIQIPGAGLPDEVFVANTALSLPRLAKPTFLMANMKYAQRKVEPLNLARHLRKMGATVIKWPHLSVWEGQGETTWFHEGRTLVVGYGFRCTKKSVADLRETLESVYRTRGVEPPLVIGVKLLDPKFYHTDLAMLSLGNRCIIQAGAISDADILILTALGIECVVRAFHDPYALNSVIKDHTIYTHVLNAKSRKVLENVCGPLKIVELDVSEFEKSGGGVRCMILTI